MSEEKITEIRASSIPRIALCPGSMKACDGLDSGTSDQAIAGTMGHAALEMYYKQNGHVTLDPEAVKPIEDFLDGLDDMTAGRARWYARELDKMLSSMGDIYDIGTEIAVHAIAENGFGKVKITGHMDLIALITDGPAVINDYKFNWLPQPVASQNLQLMTYAWLWHRQFPNKTYDIHAVLTAGGNEEPFTATVYTRDGIRKAEKHLFAIIARALEPDAKRFPSEEACKYCPAAGTSRCEESCDHIKQLPALTQPYEILPPMAECLKLFKAVKTVESFGKKFTKDLKDAVNENPEAWAEFFELANSGNTRKILDAQAAYATFVEEEKLVTHDGFMETMSVAIGKLEKACNPALVEQEIKVKDQKKHIEGLLGSNLEKKEKAKSLKAVKS